ncbi:uncharacterized protein PG998_013017 [Apiospora kogelbergensis]|uniref:uncharacterized protein n=1 Tax=Apiospora kogelbergensis TaxID=1337665 RepID=UPI00312D3A22
MSSGIDSLAPGRSIDRHGMLAILLSGELRGWKVVGPRDVYEDHVDVVFRKEHDRFILPVFIHDELASEEQSTVWVLLVDSLRYDKYLRVLWTRQAQIQFLKAIQQDHEGSQVADERG